MPIITADRKRRPVDLAAEGERFRLTCDLLARAAGKASKASVDGGFEHQLELLTIAIREWWEDLKQAPERG
jgi:hypothetical protein